MLSIDELIANANADLKLATDASANNTPNGLAEVTQRLLFTIAQAQVAAAHLLARLEERIDHPLHMAAGPPVDEEERTPMHGVWTMEPSPTHVNYMRLRGPGTEVIEVPESEAPKLAELLRAAQPSPGR